MSGDLIWEEPPRRDRGDHFAIAAQLRTQPGRWARIRRSYGYNSAKSIVYGVNIARFRAYEPRGDYEATARGTGAQTYVYVRYLGDGATDE